MCKIQDNEISWVASPFPPWFYYYYYFIAVSSEGKRFRAGLLIDYARFIASMKLIPRAQTSAHQFQWGESKVLSLSSNLQK